MTEHAQANRRRGGDPRRTRDLVIEGEATLLSRRPRPSSPPKAQPAGFARPASPRWGEALHRAEAKAKSPSWLTRKPPKLARRGGAALAGLALLALLAWPMLDASDTATRVASTQVSASVR